VLQVNGNAHTFLHQVFISCDSCPFEFYSVVINDVLTAYHSTVNSIVGPQYSVQRGDEMCERFLFLQHTVTRNSTFVILLTRCLCMVLDLACKHQYYVQ
jgi:hypothetical protein